MIKNEFFAGSKFIAVLSFGRIKDAGLLLKYADDVLAAAYGMSRPALKKFEIAPARLTVNIGRDGGYFPTLLQGVIGSVECARFFWGLNYKG